MRRSEASLALVRRIGVDGSRWLALWNVRWDAFHLVGGHRRPDEGFRDCLVREIYEELGLRDGLDCRVEPVPQAHLAYTAWSNHARAETDYTMELYTVTLEDRAEPILGDNPAVRWLTESEIQYERCRDGRPVSPTMGFLIAKAGIE